MTAKLPPGRVLLNRLLTEKQRADLDTLGYFIERSVTITVAHDPFPPRRATPTRRSHVYTGACIRIVGKRDLPPYDQAVAFLLFIRADPAGYANTANHDRTWPPRRPFAAARW